MRYMATDRDWKGEPLPAARCNRCCWTSAPTWCNEGGTFMDGWNVIASFVVELAPWSRGCWAARSESRCTGCSFISWTRPTPRWPGYYLYRSGQALPSPCCRKEDRTTAPGSAGPCARYFTTRCPVFATLGRVPGMNEADHWVLKSQVKLEMGT